jgi:hypothetical protein
VLGKKGLGLLGGDRMKRGGVPGKGSVKEEETGSK